MGKFNISNLDLYYTDFHALKNVNLGSSGERDHSVHRTFRMRKIHSVEIPESYE